MTTINKIIAIACDHGGYNLKASIAEFLESKGWQVLDLGCHSDERVDYTDYGYALADAIAENKAEFGIGICGSGIGISIALNRNNKVRAALCHDVTSAKLARQHNNANALALGGRLIGEVTALECVEIFLNTEFEGGRHADRVKKLGR